MPIKFEDYSPTTLDEAIQLVYEAMDTSEKKFIRDNGSVALHHGFGTAMRNGWKLWDRSSVLHQHFRSTYGLGHADDMSGLILEGLEHKIQDKPYDPADDVESYKAHWAKSGIDPLGEEPG